MSCCCGISALIYAVGVIVILKTLFPLLYKLVYGKKREVLEKEWKKDTVYLYQLHGTPTLPSISPFCIKVEAFLRLHKIKFERRYVVLARGSNGKVPFVELNGEQIADSQIILRRLAKFFDIKEYANDRDAAFGHAISRQLDNFTVGIFGFFKVCSATSEMTRVTLGDSAPSWLTSTLLPLLPLKHIFIARMGFNAFSEEQYRELLENELISLQNMLGDNKYLFGNEISSADLALFGHLAAVFYLASDTEPKKLLNSKTFEPLRQFTNGMRDTVFGLECSE